MAKAFANAWKNDIGVFVKTELNWSPKKRDTDLIGRLVDDVVERWMERASAEAVAAPVAAGSSEERRSACLERFRALYEQDSIRAQGLIVAMVAMMRDLGTGARMENDFTRALSQQKH